MCKMEKICVGGRKAYMVEGSHGDIKFVALTEEQIRLLEYLEKEFPFSVDLEFIPVDEIDVDCI